MFEKMIADKFRKTIFKAIKKYAKKNQCAEVDIKIFFSLNEQNENIFQVFQSIDGKMKHRENVTINELLDVRVDILKEGEKISGIIQVALIGFNDEYSMEPHAARMMMCNDNGNLVMRLYNKITVAKETVSVEEIFELIAKMSEQ